VGAWKPLQKVFGEADDSSVRRHGPRKVEETERRELLGDIPPVLLEHVWVDDAGQVLAPEEVGVEILEC
jgi:hypothetical protein